MGKESRDLDEWAVIERVRSGEVNAYAALVDRHAARVSRIVARHVPRSQAQDVSQEVFLRAFQGLKTFDGRKPFEHFLASIAVRCCCDYWRTRSSSAELPLCTLAEDGQEWMDRMTAEAGRASFEEESDRRAARELLDWGLSRLGPEDRMVLTLTSLEGYSTLETARLMGVSAASVKVRAFRSRARLLKILTQAQGGER